MAGRRTTRRITHAALAVVAATAVAVTGLTGSAYAAAPAAADGQSGQSGQSGQGAGHEATRKALEAAVAEGAPGALAVAERGRRAWAGTAGVGDLRTGEKRQAQERFRAGSITKTFVATVLLQLEAEGRLSLDDSVEKWLPGLVQGNGHSGRTITLRQLLNHTSGVFSYTEDEAFVEKVFGPGFLRHRYDTWKPEQLVRVAMAHQPYFAPGTDWRYSNTNYVLAGLVIEKATGNPYAKEVQRRILGPLHLDATVLPGTRAGMPEPAGRAYSKLSPEATGPTHDVTELNPSIAGAAGEIVTDARDLNDFYRALLSGRLLGPRQLRDMTTTVPVPGAEGVGYGLGIMSIRLSCGTEVWGHGGGIHGSSSTAVVTRDTRHALAANLNGDWAGNTQTVVEAEFCGTE
ncbi:peptidase [Streptomyces venezuelae]|uniref:Peptidase n=1 Tax=Streptomyces venezuelae TaxID=54571 RepID=A0A5P2CWQ1_STRVZ|nr:serine hydrolase domain-containing protein [Streptomyces venezuelae]QES46700.1 peptidase [Streptomyces venezuelae]